MGSDRWVGTIPGSVKTASVYVCLCERLDAHLCAVFFKLFYKTGYSQACHIQQVLLSPVDLKRSLSQCHTSWLQVVLLTASRCADECAALVLGGRRKKEQGDTVVLLVPVCLPPLLWTLC